MRRLIGKAFDYSSILHVPRPFDRKASRAEPWSDRLDLYEHEASGRLLTVILEANMNGDQAVLLNRRQIKVPIKDSFQGCLRLPLESMSCPTEQQEKARGGRSM